MASDTGGMNPTDILVDALQRIIHREHLFARAHIEVRGKIDNGGCSGCRAEEALADYRAAIKRHVDGSAPKKAESIYCACCGGSIVECGCTWRDGSHDGREGVPYCMLHAQWCPEEPCDGE